MVNIKIDKLDIRLKNISPQIASDMIDGLEVRLLNEFIKTSKPIMLPSPNNKNLIKIDKVNLGSVKIPRESQNSIDLQKLLVNRISESVSSSMQEK